MLGVTDGIATSLNLGHATLISLTADIDLRVDVKANKITVSGNSQYNEVFIVDQDIDGYWDFPNVYSVVSGLNDIDNLSASVAANASGLPAMLLEEQSSYIKVVGEQVPLVQQFTLGQVDAVDLNNNKVITDLVEFTDNDVYILQVSGVPVRQGEWRVTETGTVTSVTQPTRVGFVNYTYNLLSSGSSMNLLGNGVKVFNMTDLSLQQLMFTASGIGGTAKSVVDEINAWDKNFWGK